MADGMPMTPGRGWGSVTVAPDPGRMALAQPAPGPDTVPAMVPAVSGQVVELGGPSRMQRLVWALAVGGGVYLMTRGQRRMTYAALAGAAAGIFGPQLAARLRQR